MVQFEVFSLCMILAGAAWTDLRSGKVNNRWLFLGMILGVGYRGWSFFPAAVIVLIPAFWLWHLRMMGAADGKIMALITGFLGISRGLRAVWAGLCIGAVWSLCRFWHDGSLRARLLYLSAYVMRMAAQNRTEYDDWSVNDGSGRHRIPLAVCLAAGVYLYLLTEILLRPGI